MDSGFVPTKSTTKSTFKISGNTIALLICMGIACTLWLLTKLSNNYIGEIKAKVVYTNLPKDKIPVSPLVNELSLMVETSGFRLLTSPFRLKIPTITVDFNQFGKEGYALSENIYPFITNTLSSDYKLLKIYPDSLYFDFSEKMSKVVPVIPNIKIFFEKQFDYKEDLLVSPASIKIEGPLATIDTITNWTTELISFTDLNESVELEINLVPPISKSIKLSATKVKITIAVEEYTEQTMEIEVMPVNFSEKLNLNIYPKKITSTFRVGLSNYDVVKNAEFEAIADFSGLDMNSTRFVDVTISKSPSYIKNLNYTPKSVEFIIYN